MVLGKLPVPGCPTILMSVGQGPIALAVGAGGVVWTFLLSCILPPLTPSLWEMARYRLKYCLKGPLKPKQPTNQPSSRLSAKDLDDLVPQLDSPFILLGDFNGHHILWGSKDINDKGRIIENFIDNHGLCLYNTKTPTYLQPATGTYTSLDLSICFPTLLLDYDWKVHDELCGSDHFPVL